MPQKVNIELKNHCKSLRVLKETNWKTIKNIHKMTLARHVFVHKLQLPAKFTKHIISSFNLVWNRTTKSDEVFAITCLNLSKEQQLELMMQIPQPCMDHNTPAHIWAPDTGEELIFTDTCF